MINREDLDVNLFHDLQDVGIAHLYANDKLRAAQTKAKTLKEVHYDSELVSRLSFPYRKRIVIQTLEPPFSTTFTSFYSIFIDFYTIFIDFYSIFLDFYSIFDTQLRSSEQHYARGNSIGGYRTPEAPFSTTFTNSFSIFKNSHSIFNARS